MSAFPTSAPPRRAPEGAGPEPLAPSPQRHFARTGTVALLVVAIAAAGWLLRPKPRAHTAATLIRTVKAARGILENSIRVTGSITAREFANITGPIMRGPDAGRGLVLIYLAESGTRVRKDQVVAQIDGQSVKDHLDDVEATLLQAELDIEKRKAQQSAETEMVRQRLRAAKAAWDKARMDAGASAVKTAITQELLKLASEEAQATYEEVRQEVAMVEERQRLDLSLLRIALNRQTIHRDRHKSDYIRFTVKAPMDGLVVMQTLRRRGGDQAQIKVGDEIAPGQPFMRIVNTSSLQLDATINQAESELVRIGQRVTVRFDAFPELVLKGKVQSVGALAGGGRWANYYIRTIPVRIAIRADDRRIIPDLSASGDVVISEQPGALIVPREAVRETARKPVVYVRQAGTFTPREVEIGAYSNTQVAVVSGLEAGEEVALPPPAPLNP